MSSFLFPTLAISVYRGSSTTFDMAITDDSGNPVDLTACKLHFTVKKRATDTTSLVYKSSAQSTEINITNAKAGKATLYLLSSDTLLDPKQYVYDVWLELSTHEKVIVVSPSVFEVLQPVSSFG